MAWIGPAISAGAAIVGGAMGQSAQAGANRMNLQIWREQRQFMDMQSRTEIQRRVQDMKLAGINPMLSVMGMGSASSPNVGPPNIRPEDSLAEGVKASGSSAVAALGAMAQLQSIQASTRNVLADAKLKEAQIPWAAQNAQMTSENLFSQMKILAAQVQKAGIETELKNIDLKQMQPLVIQYQSMMNQAIAAGLPAAKAEEEFYKNVPQAKWIAIIRGVLGLSGDNIIRQAPALNR